MSVRPDWIGVDWGTTHLRAWALGADGRILDRATSPSGMARVDPGGFEPALLALVQPWLASGVTTPVIACGMVGARQGWIEAPYRQTPCAALQATDLARPEVADRRLSVHIVPGICQADPADVMRGEETQIAGFLADTAFDSTICLPGTHSKWVTVDGGCITGFRTMMTGEIFALLSQQSVLRHSIGSGWDDLAFLAAYQRARAAPEQIAGSLFSLRADALVHGLDPDCARSALSGMLIGAEIAAAQPMAGTIAVLGSSGAAGAYRTALQADGHAVITVDAETAVLRGLGLVHDSLKGPLEHAP